jgi:hypothetical protein
MISGLPSMYGANTTSSLTVIMTMNYWKPHGNIRKNPSSLVLSWPVQDFSTTLTVIFLSSAFPYPSLQATIVVPVAGAQTILVS